LLKFRRVHHGGQSAKMAILEVFAQKKPPPKTGDGIKQNNYEKKTIG
jgi:hypothetical protein